jgi:glycine cleavage system H protein
LADNLETISHDPYGQGWMVKIKVADAGALAGLLGPDEYRKHAESEAGH